PPARTSLSLHDALPICALPHEVTQLALDRVDLGAAGAAERRRAARGRRLERGGAQPRPWPARDEGGHPVAGDAAEHRRLRDTVADRKSTRLNSSHVAIS